MTGCPRSSAGCAGFIQVLAEVASHEEFTLPDGTRLAAVKFAFGGGALIRGEPNNPDAERATAVGRRR